jgi:hypothetical protein
MYNWVALRGISPQCAILSDFRNPGILFQVSIFGVHSRGTGANVHGKQSITMNICGRLFRPLFHDHSFPNYKGAQKRGS